ncbi:MAG: methyl-accepting chemotaxis protein [Clostridiales Family XIII bacterium]|jgi:methyl-accepting chemotaxis protein|nr:methyl-accepting chemotaxis protein [Clostridiales Family XIII bacterium]
MKKKIRLKSLILLNVYALVLITVALVGGTDMATTYNDAVETTRSNLDYLSVTSVGNVERRVDNVKQELQIEGTNPVVKDHSLPVEERAEMLLAACDHSYFEEFTVARADGVTYNGGGKITIADREYFRKAMDGTPYISSPLVKRLGGGLVMMAAARLDDGNGAMFGVISVDTFREAIQDIKLGESGFAFVLDKYGTVILHPDDDVIAGMMTFEKLSEAGIGDTVRLAALAPLTETMTAGETGVTEIDAAGTKYFVAYRPVSGPESWSLGVIVPKDEMLGNFYALTRTSLIALVVMLILGFFLALRLSTTLSRPLVLVSERLRRLSEGDLHTDYETDGPAARAARSQKADPAREYLELRESVTNTVSYLNSYIEDIDHVLGNIADGNLDVSSGIAYKGDFVGIEKSLRHILGTLNATMHTISMSSGTVLAGSKQISTSAQSLRDGSIDAASSIKSIKQSMSRINDSFADVVAETTNAGSLAALAGETAVDGNTKMRELLTTIEGISRAAESIQLINKAIDEIAFQTNILALNAAVEAARAGNAGRGFTVVADEVRTLANKCAEASNNTAKLIDSVLGAISDGTVSAAETAAILERIVEHSHRVRESISALTDTAAKQAGEMDEVSRDIDRISAVTGSVSLASEEFAATSRSFESQAASLEQVIASFRVDEDEE